MREAFFINQLSHGHILTYPKRGDFLIDDKFLFEVGIQRFECALAKALLA